MNKTQVLCNFRFGGTTVPLQRESLDMANMDWATAKAGLAADRQQDRRASDFFVGLQQLHELTSQADYEVHVSLFGGNTGAGTLYSGFTVGPESSSYSLTYGRCVQYFPPPHPIPYPLPPHASTSFFLPESAKSVCARTNSKIASSPYLEADMNKSAAS